MLSAAGVPSVGDSMTCAAVSELRSEQGVPDGAGHVRSTSRPSSRPGRRRRTRARLVIRIDQPRHPPFQRSAVDKPLIETWWPIVSAIGDERSPFPRALAKAFAVAVDADQFEFASRSARSSSSMTSTC